MIFFHFFSLLFCVIKNEEYYDNKNISLINSNIINVHRFDQNLIDQLFTHNVFNEEQYQKEKLDYQNLHSKYANDIRNEKYKEIEDHLYIKMNKKNSNIYTNKKILNQTVLGLYAGLITDKANIKKSQYKYISNFQNKKQLYVETDEFKSFMQYAFYGSDHGNCDAIQFVYDNLWYYVLVANQDIDEQSEIIIQNGYNSNLKQKYQQRKTNKYYEDLTNGQHLQHSDFPKLDLEYLDDVKIDLELSHLINNHDITQDTYYKKNKNYMKMQLRGYENDIENIQDLDDLIYFKYISDTVGYGAFAKRNLPNNFIIGKYTGVLRQFKKNTLYAWNYQTSLDEYGINSLVIDGIKEGNMLRFVNDLGVYNLEILILPYEGLWCYYYLTNKQINKDEQLSISYGKDYWKDKHQYIIEELKTEL